jgi:acyl carrier protein
MDQVEQDTIEQKIHAFLLDKFPLARRARVSKDTSLLESGILDSLGILDVVAFLESEFMIRIADEELVPENFRSLGALSAFVRQKSGAE